MDSNTPEFSDILSSLMKQFPNLHYFRKTYRSELRFDLLRKELLQVAKDYNINPENAGFLTSNLKFFADEKHSLSSLGVVFQFDPAKLPTQARVLKGLSGAVFGELAEYAKLDRQIRDRALAEAQSRGLFGSVGGAYSLNLDLWIKSRQAFSTAA